MAVKSSSGVRGGGAEGAEASPPSSILNVNNFFRTKLVDPRFYYIYFFSLESSMQQRMLSTSFIVRPISSGHTDLIRVLTRLIRELALY